MSFPRSSPQVGKPIAGRGRAGFVSVTEVLPVGWFVVSPAEPSSPADTPHYLVGLQLSGRRVVVVGGGGVARRRVGALLACGARVEVVAPWVTPVIAALADGGQLHITAREYRAGDLEGAWYVLACTNDPETNAAVVAEATDHRIFCVRADHAAGGTAVTPATTQQRGVTLGVLSGGDHRRSARIRNALLEAFQTGSIPIDDQPLSAGVALLGAGPGAPDLLTLRARRLLTRADIVVADRLTPPELLAGLDPHVTVIDAAKVPHGPGMSQTAINETLIAGARDGKFVARLKGGDPYVFGRGFEEVEACVAAGVPVTVVPGVTSPIAVPAAAGIPVTHRGLTHEFVVVSGHIPPGHPNSLVDWAAVARLRGTLVLVMAIEHLDRIAAALLAEGRHPDTPAAIVQEGTLLTQHTLRTRLADLTTRARAADIRPPAVVIIGPTAGFSADSDSGDAP